MEDGGLIEKSIPSEIQGLKESKLESILSQAKEAFTLNHKIDLGHDGKEKLASLGWVYSALRPNINRLILYYYSNSLQLGLKIPSMDIIRRVLDDIEYLAIMDLSDLVTWRKDFVPAKGVIKKLKKEINEYINFRWHNAPRSKIPKDMQKDCDYVIQRQMPEIFIYLDRRFFAYQRRCVASAPIENKSGEDWRKERIYPLQIFSLLLDTKNMNNLRRITGNDSIEEHQFIAAMRLNADEVGSYIRLMKKGGDHRLALHAVKSGKDAITAYRQVL